MRPPIASTIHAIFTLLSTQSQQSQQQLRQQLPQHSLRYLLAGLLVTLLMGCASLPASALTVGSGNVLTGSKDNSEATTNVQTADPFGRDTPRGTVQGFIRALADNDTLLASNYLNLSHADNPNNTVRQFKQVLDAGGRISQDLQISNEPDGNLADRLPPNQEKIGTINIGDQSVNILLERVTKRNGERYWQFSAETIRAVPQLASSIEPTLVERYTFDALKGKKVFSYDLADMMAVLLLSLTLLFLAYVLVWALFFIMARLYPKLRNRPLPLDSKVIVPTALVLTSLLLSEVMVYAGVSVTVRDPVNRIKEIISWLALTWLLLRLIDGVFNRAEKISYRSNYIERVSILSLLRKLAKALLLIFAGIVVFGNLGFDLTTGIAALGVGGLALALGAQKTIENLVGSVVVVADRPVRVGDYCRFGSLEGTVIDIGIRSTRIRTLSRTIVTVPNGDFSSMQIENYAPRDMFRFWHRLYIKRSADIRVLKQMVLDLNEFLAEHELTNCEWNQAYLTELRQDCYVIEVQAYVNATGGVREFYDKQSSLLMDLLSEVAKYPVEHALPTQQLLLDGEVAGRQQAASTQDDKDKVSLPFSAARQSASVANSELDSKQKTGQQSPTADAEKTTQNGANGAKGSVDKPASEDIADQAARQQRLLSLVPAMPTPLSGWLKQHFKG